MASGLGAPKAGARRLGPQRLSWVCYFRALQLGEASRVAPIDKLSVVFVIGLSVMFLGERLPLRESYGAALIVAGALLLAWK